MMILLRLITVKFIQFHKAVICAIRIFYMYIKQEIPQSKFVHTYLWRMFHNQLITVSYNE